MGALALFLNILPCNENARLGFVRNPYIQPAQADVRAVKVFYGAPRRPPVPGLRPEMYGVKCVCLFDSEKQQS